MIKLCGFKILKYYTFSTLIVLLFSSTLFAESVFIKDGSIVEGEIIKEDDFKIELKISSGETKVILRTDVLRALFHVRYKEKKIINKTDGTRIEAYIVDEDGDSHTYRSELDSTEEIKILKDEIYQISKYRPADSMIVIYNGNGNTGGSAPSDKSYYKSGQNISVSANSGNLVKKGYMFSGWNTKPDGRGTSYDTGQKLAVNLSDVILYARWTVILSDAEKEAIEQYNNMLKGYYIRGIIPGWGQFYSGHYVKGTLFGLSFIGSAAWAVSANVKYRKSRGEYNSLTSDDTDDEFDSAYDKAEKNGKTALWSVLTTIGIYALNWGDILLYSKPENWKNISMFRCGDAYVNLVVMPNDKAFLEHSAGLRAEMDISIRF